MRNWIDLFEGIVAYHGTNQPFDTFSTERRCISTGEGCGAAHAFFFTNDPEEAKEYALKAGRTVVADIDSYEAEYARLEAEVQRLEKDARRTGNWTPYERAVEAWESFEANAIYQDETEGFRIIKAELQLNNPLVLDCQGKSPLIVGDLDEVFAQAKADGHDGVILKDINDSPKGGFVSTHYAVFDADQITILD